MDSVRSLPPAGADLAEFDGPASPEVFGTASGGLPLVEAPPSRTVRGIRSLARLGPTARRAVRVARKTAVAGALGAAAVWAALFGQGLLAGTLPWGLALVVGVVLLVPPAAAAVLAWTLADLVALPGTLRDAATNVAAGVRPEAGEGGLFRTVWALRGLAAEGAGAWAAATGLVRLARLPFVLGLLVLVALNAVVVVAGIAALAWMVL